MLKKRAISLIETVISMTLVTLLLSSLFFWYRHLSGKKHELEKMQHPYIEEQYAYQRLSAIVGKAKIPFFTEDGLIFLFDRGLHFEPKLSGTVLGKLYYDPALKVLCLGIWPDPIKELITDPMQTLILLDQIDHLSFSFYSPPNPFGKIVDSKPVGHLLPKEGWQESWYSDYNQLPALVKMIIERDGRMQKFYFDLNQPIIYPIGKT